MSWTSVHCRLSWQAEDVDAFIVGRLVPLLDTEWFYVRYWDSGPHLRIRYRDGHDITSEIRNLIEEAGYPILDIEPAAYYAHIGAPDRPWLPHGDVREVPYEPEVERYGGREALAVAEDLFCRSTEVATAVLRSAPTLSAKISAGIQLATATTRALDFDRPQAAAWLRTMGASWRYAQEPATLESHVAAHKILAKHGKDLSAKWDREPSGAGAHWIEQLRKARAAVDVPDRVWASQLHMLFNRIGINPDQERVICWVTAAALLSPQGVSPFHDNDLDRQYLEASKFLPGFPDQFPRTAQKPARQPLWTTSLPEPEVVSAKLVDALEARHTSRNLNGTLNTQQLATLLWTAQAGHPYPSAGAKYCARIRVIAKDVTGLRPGCYDVDEVDRTLAWTGPCPSTEDLEHTSMWFGAGRTELARTPAILALYVRIGDLRETYGMRALRFAFAEAGHLAQNLSLVAAAMGLSIGLVGGIYDDLAHDLLVLDGVNDTLAYLLPVATRQFTERS